MKLTIPSLKAAAVIAAAIFSLPSHATIISADDAIFGTDSITFDTSTNLEWLDVTLSIGRSFSDVSLNLGAGGDYEGFRYASGDELQVLITNFTGKVSTSHLSYNYYSEGTDSIDQLIILLGNTNATANPSLVDPRVFARTAGIIGDEVRNVVRTSELVDYSEFLLFDEDDYSKIYSSRTRPNSAVPTLGSFLVREIIHVRVPEPSILALMGLGIFGLGLARRKIKK